ncbi:MAG: hypothetical protein KJT03_21930 [Verrucomicrobiae bacterium]|nr:hypothetical protein [Verrucomicrobiae bacterium]
MKAGSRSSGDFYPMGFGAKLSLLLVFAAGIAASALPVVAAKSECDEASIAKKIFSAPRWWGLDLEDRESTARLEEVINELAVLEIECFRSVVAYYFEHYMGDDEESRVASKATFHLIFYAYCNVDSRDWRDYTGPFTDSQLFYDDSWNLGDPWLLEFLDSGVKIIARPVSHGGSFGNYEASFHLPKIFEQQYSRYGARNYRPNLKTSSIP